MKRTVPLIVVTCCLMVAIVSAGRFAAQVTGDVNGDGSVNALDVQLTINGALGIDIGGRDADINDDGSVNALDVQLCINAALGITNGGLPPDPKDVAPDVDPTVPTNLADATEFIYTGDDPIQTDVSPGAIEATRVVVLRGRVMTVEGDPLPGVQITILNHPEYGQTLTRADGMFDMAVNGGVLLTVNYRNEDYLSAQRQVDVPVQDYVWLPDVVLTALDPEVTVIDFSEPVQVARGSAVEDEDGSRRATLLVPQGAGAKMKLATGKRKDLDTMSVRATEYTVGESGPAAMPALLPPESGYTYCVEYSVDEAIDAGAVTVEFDEAVIHYVENFLDFPVGGKVPTGYYDREKAVWLASQNGRVVEIVSITGEMADLDIDGDGAPDNATGLADLGITDEERRQLAAIYQAGQSLWRVPMTHFTPWDCNWPYGPPADANAPDPPPPDDQPEEDDCEESSGGDDSGGGDGGGRGGSRGSGFRGSSQELIQRIPIVGTPFALHYQSSRVPGNRKAYSTDIPLSGETIPGSLKGIELEVGIAGQRFTDSFGAEAGQNSSFEWDGKDGYGRDLKGSGPADIGIGYVYDGVYMEPAEFEDSFGRLGEETIVGRGTRDEIVLWTHSQRTLGILTVPGPEALGGWTLNVHHTYDTEAQVLYRGDGKIRKVEGEDASAITIFAGDPTRGYSAGDAGDGGPATEALFKLAYAVELGPDGSLYIADPGSFVNQIRRVGLDGIITTVAGKGGRGDFSGDGGPATEAEFAGPKAIAVADDGSFYIADSANQRIRRVGPDGIVTTVAGTGEMASGGDGGPATEAQLMYPIDVEIGPDGLLYIAELLHVRRVSSDGIITTVVGNGTDEYAGDGSLATETGVLCFGIEVGPDGSIWIANTPEHCVSRVNPDGIINRVAGAGDGLDGFSGDGGPATSARLKNPWDISLGPDGSLFIADAENARIRRVNLMGIITTVAGNGEEIFLPDDFLRGMGGPATEAPLYFPIDVVVGPDGTFYIADFPVVRRVARGRQQAVVSEDGTELYEFDTHGRHLRTLDTLTCTAIYSFDYDDDGLLAQIEDRDGRVTNVQRDENGCPTAIVAPLGQRTTFTLDARGWLATVTDPAGHTYEITYDGTGLMTGLADPAGNEYGHAYDEQGLLVGIDAPGGGGKTLTRTATENGYEVSVTTAMGRTTTYGVEHLPTGEKHLVTTFGCCGQAEALIDPDGNSELTYADGTVVAEMLGPDPRWGMQAPMVTEWTMTTPGGVQYVRNTERTATTSDPTSPLCMGGLTETVVVNGHAYSRSYDADQRLRATESPLGRRQFTWLDEQGRVAKLQIEGLEPVEYAYASNGRLQTVTNAPGPDARVYQLSYDANGYVDSVTDPMQRTVSFEYDSAGRVTRQVTPDGRETLYTYDENGNVTSVTPPGRPAHQYAYTATDLQEDYVPPDVGAGANLTHYDYNVDGQIELVTRPDGQTVDFEYNAAGRLDHIVMPRGQVDFAYGPATGQVTSVTTPEGDIISFGWDGILLAETSWSGDVAGSVARTYNNDMRVVALSIDDTHSIAFGYDDDSLLVQAGDMTLTRDAQNGFVVSTTLGQVATMRGYDGFGQLTSYRAEFSGAPIFETAYVRDSINRITQKTETIDGVTMVYSYVYDQAGRLAETLRDGVTTSTYGYDDNGNRATHTDEDSVVTTGSYDNQDRMVQYGNTTYTYTDNGELLTKTETGGQVTHYDYDVMGNLQAVTLPDGTQIDYVIDGRNRRVGKSVNGSSAQGFLYVDDLNPVAELDGGDNVVSLFVYASRPNVPDYIVSRKADGVTWVAYRLVCDHLGTPRLAVDAATGQVVQRLDYDEFGNVTDDTNPGFQPFGFAGGLYDRHTGLTRFGARDYDAATGRWTAKDPIGFSGGDTNHYGYVLGDPVNSMDSSGRQASGPVCKIEVTVDPPDPTTEEGYEYRGTRITVDGEVVSGKDVHYPNEGAAKTSSVTIVDNHQLTHDIQITHVYGKPEIVIDFTRR
jgi:RHS repeat-associated protein